MALVPHPSGLNHFYNDPLNKELVAVFLQELVEFSRTHEDPTVVPPGPVQGSLL